MSFGLGRGRPLDAAPGVVGVAPEELGPLPDGIAENPAAGWVDVRALFAPPAQPVEVEIGPGKGAFLLEQASASPETNYLAIEWAGEFYAYTADRVRRRGLSNVRVLHADGREFLRWRTPSESIRVIHLYFSDPWPKRKHHKNRVVQDRFLAHAWRVLQRGDPERDVPPGEIRIVTDHDDYWAWMQEHFARWSGPEGWTLAAQLAGVGPDAAGDEPRAEGPFSIHPFEPPAWARDGELVGTNFERKFRVEGRSFHGCVLRKNAG